MVNPSGVGAISGERSSPNANFVRTRSRSSSSGWASQGASPTSEDAGPRRRPRSGIAIWRSLPQSRGAGFTLVEVLVALVVFAVLGFTVTSRVGDVVNQTYSLERRTVAHWVGENYLNRLRLSRLTSDEPLPTGRDRERVVMAGREWIVETEVQQTSYPLLRRVDLTVLAVIDGDETGPVDSLVAFVGRH